MNCLIVDHFDSFTYNIKTWLNSVQIKTSVLPYNQLEQINTFDFILLSAGPGNINDYPKSKELIKTYYGKIPIFGICLGFQLLISYYNEKIIKINPIHGKSSKLNIIKKSIFFENIDNNLEVARYHSLGALYNKQKIVTSLINNLIMSIEDNCVLGVQFHPESFLSTNSKQMALNLKKWVNKCKT